VKAKRKLAAVSTELIFTVVLRTPQDEVAFAQARAQKNYARHEVATRAQRTTRSTSALANRKAGGTALI
jgi:hypothetical protein